MLYVAIWYVSIRPVVMRVKEELQHKNAPEDGLLKSETFELLNVMNKINHQILCILLDYRYIAK